MALTLDIAANTRAAVSNVKDVGQALDDVSDALDDLARDAKQRGMTTERAMSDVGRAGRDVGTDIDQAGEKVERTFRDMVQDARKAETAVADVGTKGARDLSRVREAGEEVTQEIGSNLGEAVSSIRGDMSDLGQVGQDTLGGLAATLAGGGPAGIVGAAALAAGAVGLGLITAELEKQQEEADALRDRLSSAYASAAEDGRAYLDTAALIAEANDLMFNPDRADEWKRLQEDANMLGVSRADIAAANAGDLAKQEEVQRRINGLIDEQNSKPRQDGFLGTAEWDEDMKRLRDVRDRWDAINTVTEEYAETAAVVAQITREYKSTTKDAMSEAKAATDRQREALGKLHKEYDGITAEKTVKVKVDVDDSAWRGWRPGLKYGAVSARPSNGTRFLY